MDGDNDSFSEKYTLHKQVDIQFFDAAPAWEIVKDSETEEYLQDI